MTNSKREYNEFIRANLPYGIEYDSARYQYVTFNGKRFVTYLEAKWYIDYLTKFGGGPEDDIRNDLFGTSEEGVWFEANDATTLFTDTAGTTPVTTPGDAVALQLDKSGRGNHRTQATTAARPLYALHPVGGVRNLLQYTEEFDNAVWVKSNLTVTPNTATAPDGTTTADKIVATANNGFARQASAPVTFTNNASIINIATGVIETTLVGSFDSLEASVKANGWTKVSGSKQGYTFSFEAKAAEWGFVQIQLFGTSVYIYPAETPTSSGTADGTSGIFIWGAQLEQGSTATNYQRVGSFLDVSEEGKARRGRLWYNGTSHFMETGTITPGADKVQVFAGVRKLSDAAAGILIESSTISETSNGAFGIAAPGSSAKFIAICGGTIIRTAGTTDAAYNAPTTRVVSTFGDISGDRVALHIDGTQVAQSTGSQGTGNFLAYPIYFGARAGTSLFYNGYEDTSIIRFGPNLDDTTISKVESYVASKTPEPTL